jgi:hypothetical protein
MTALRDHAAPDDAVRARLDRLQYLALQVGGVGLALCIAGGLIWPHSFSASYLVAFLFWTGITLGCIGLTMLHHLVGGQWGLPIRRPMEAGASTVIPLAALFVPLALNLPALYRWARPEEVRLDAELAHKAVYLNVPFFLARAAFYFVLWAAFAAMLRRWSRAQDEDADPSPSRRLQNLSGPGLVFLFLTSTFAAIDWGMSLEPRWSSTIYGAMLVTGEALSALALMIAIAILLASDPPMTDAATPARLHDLGNLLLAFVMLWAYMAFSQFLIIWSGNLAEETPWYIRRTHGGWQWVALVLIGFHFFLPFFVLLFRESKRQPQLLLRVASLVLAMHLVDLIWLVVPASSDLTSPRIPWGDLPPILAAMAGIGGIWAGAFLWQLKGSPLVPLNDPNLSPALEHQGAH